VSFGSMQKLIGADQDRATFTLRPWARAHSVLLEKYLAGYIQGQRWLDDPANKAAVIALVMKENKIDADTAAGWYAAEIQAGAYPKDARFNEDNFKRTLQLRAEVEGGGKKQAAQPERYIDLSYYRAALAKLK
jgi:ABC-type nitrate/sulfonate/bicarbonate transport system substrate-binding protein